MRLGGMHDTVSHMSRMSEWTRLSKTARSEGSEDDSIVEITVGITVEIAVFGGSFEVFGMRPVAVLAQEILCKFKNARKAHRPAERRKATEMILNTG